MNDYYFEIRESTLAAVCEMVREVLPDLDDETIAEFILADWPTGLEHQDWLDNASPDDIAAWAIAGLL